MDTQLKLTVAGILLHCFLRSIFLLFSTGLDGDRESGLLWKP